MSTVVVQLILVQTFKIQIEKKDTIINGAIGTE